MTSRERASGERLLPPTRETAAAAVHPAPSSHQCHAANPAHPRPHRRRCSPVLAHARCAVVRTPSAQEHRRSHPRRRPALSTIRQPPAARRQHHHASPTTATASWCRRRARQRVGDHRQRGSSRTAEAVERGVGVDASGKRQATPRQPASAQPRQADGRTAWLLRLDVPGVSPVGAPIGPPWSSEPIAAQAAGRPLSRPPSWQLSGSVAGSVAIAEAPPGRRAQGGSRPPHARGGAVPGPPGGRH